MKIVTSLRACHPLLRRWAILSVCGLPFFCALAGHAQSTMWLTKSIVVIHAQVADGSVPEGVEVRIRPVQSDPPTTLPPEPKVEGSNGNWAVPGVVYGNWEITLSSSNFARVNPYFIHITGGGNYSASFRLFRGVNLRGRVVDADSGTPLAGARLEADQLETTTDEKGNYEIRRASPGTDHIIAQATNFVTQRTEVGGTPDDWNIIVPDIQLHRGGWISGRVVLPAGAPKGTVAGVVPAIEGGNGLPGAIYPEVVVSPTGTFRLGPLPPGSYGLRTNPHAESTNGGASWMARGAVTGIKVEAGKETGNVTIKTDAVLIPQARSNK